ncbi:unnamed protein product [Rotaria magnacalcarata]|uniref:Uncharacterized protein n=1 Tax=Rotaria magnacalcarata TaxID=392030 RepID=A0A8S3D1G1_9BILA|nr:unnamed protein product [Rotaria magnacalcarata]
MQQFQSKYHYGTPLSINSSSSSTSVSPNKLNGIFPSHRLSQTSASIQSITPNQSRLVTNCDNELKLSEKVKYILLIMILTFTYAFLPTITIELATTLAKYKKENDLLSSMNEISNLTQINNEIRLEGLLSILWYLSFYLIFRSMAILVSSQIIILYSIKKNIKTNAWMDIFT